MAAPVRRKPPDFGRGSPARRTPEALPATRGKTCHAAGCRGFRSFLTQQIGKPNTHAFAYGIAGKSVIIVNIESAQPDAVADGIYRQLKGATKAQFSKEWPGVLIAALSDLTSAQLRNFVGRRNALQEIASRLFNNSERAFLHTVAFVSAGDMQRTSEILGTRRVELMTDDGPSYMFRNPGHPYGKHPEYNFFNASPALLNTPSISAG